MGSSSDKVVLVTGGAGHIGSHLIEELLRDKSVKEVISLDNYFNGSRANHIDGARYIHGHTKDIDTLIDVNPDIVYHLGEYARIAPSFEDVELVHEMNVLGTFSVLEFCRKRSVSKLVYAASSTKFAIEGDGKNQNPYSFSKAQNVDLVKNYHRWYELPFAICYFYNAFGPRENGRGKYATLLAKFEQQYLNGEALTIIAPGTQKRSFTYVKDLARGIAMVGEKGSGGGYALNSLLSHSINEIAEAFSCKTEFIEGYPGRSDTKGNPTKAHNELGWSTTVDVLDYIANFIKNNEPIRSKV